jgi:hypothetical protein
MPRHPPLGTLAWARQTQGILRGGDHWTLLGQAFLYALSTLPAEVRRVLGIRRGGLIPVDPSTLEPPDSRACREAERLVAESTPPTVAGHSRRTYAWAAALAARDRLTFDREVVYVASLLHDLYFARPRTRPEPQCFTLPAADDALALAANCGWDQGRATAAAEAITLHANVWPPRESPEAYLVFAGSRLDVIGYRYSDLHADTVRQVLERHPRLDFKRSSPPLFAAQSAANPGTRVHFLTRLAGVNWYMGRAPFDE